MDIQRSKRRGKANCWVVIPITNQQVIDNLIEVQKWLEEKYKTARGELRKGFTDFTSNEVHITLFAVHANKARLELVRTALIAYARKIEEENLDETFEIEIKGLGSWNTKSGNIVLYADFTPESRAKIQSFSKELRDYTKLLLDYLIEEEDAAKNATDKESVTQSTNVSSSTDETQNNSFAEEEDKCNNKEDDSEEEEGSDDSDEDIDGVWMDNPREDEYIPHLTIMNSDPKWDKKLRTLLNDKNKKKRNESSEKFGWSYSLMRDVRTAFSKTTFGIQRVDFVELQSGFTCLERIHLKPNPQSDPSP